MQSFRKVRGRNGFYLSVRSCDVKRQHLAVMGVAVKGETSFCFAFSGAQEILQARSERCGTIIELASSYAGSPSHYKSPLAQITWPLVVAARFYTIFFCNCHYVKKKEEELTRFLGIMNVKKKIK